MNDPIRVMLEHGKKKRVVASAFEWPGWDRNTKLGGDALAVPDTYRSGFAKGRFGFEGGVRVHGG